MKEFDNILIFGLGLIGGSIAKKLKDSSYTGQVYGFDKDPEILQKAKNQNLILIRVFFLTPRPESFLRDCLAFSHASHHSPPVVLTARPPLNRQDNRHAVPREAPRRPQGRAARAQKAQQKAREEEAAAAAQ